jgi:hypothetical protein
MRHAMSHLSHHKIYHAHLILTCSMSSKLSAVCLMGNLPGFGEPWPLHCGCFAPKQVKFDK